MREGGSEMDATRLSILKWSCLNYIEYSYEVLKISYEASISCICSIYCKSLMYYASMLLSDEIGKIIDSEHGDPTTQYHAWPHVQVLQPLLFISYKCVFLLFPMWWLLFESTLRKSIIIHILPLTWVMSGSFLLKIPIKRTTGSQQFGGWGHCWCVARCTPCCWMLGKLRYWCQRL